MLISIIMWIYLFCLTTIHIFEIKWPLLSFQTTRFSLHGQKIDCLIVMRIKGSNMNIYCQSILYDIFWLAFSYYIVLDTSKAFCASRWKKLADTADKKDDGHWILFCTPSQTCILLVYKATLSFKLKSKG